MIGSGRLRTPASRRRNRPSAPFSVRNSLQKLNVGHLIIVQIWLFLRFSSKQDPFLVRFLKDSRG